jgi:protein O-GlcNAc transferase
LTGAIHYHLGNYAQSVQFNERCLQLDPTIAEAHANLANSLQQLGHLSMATAYYQVWWTGQVSSTANASSMLRFVR